MSITDFGKWQRSALHSKVNNMDITCSLDKHQNYSLSNGEESNVSETKQNKD